MSALAIYEQQAAQITAHVNAVDQQVDAVERELGTLYAAADQQGDDALKQASVSAWQRVQWLREQHREHLARHAALLKTAQEIVSDIQQWNHENPDVARLMVEIETVQHEIVWSNLTAMVMQNTGLTLEGASLLTDLLFSTPDALDDTFSEQQLSFFQTHIQALVAQIGDWSE